MALGRRIRPPRSLFDAEDRTGGILNDVAQAVSSSPRRLACHAAVSGVIQDLYCATDNQSEVGQLCAKIDAHPIKYW